MVIAGSNLETTVVGKCAGANAVSTTGGAEAPMQQLAHWLHLPCALDGEWFSFLPQCASVAAS